MGQSKAKRKCELRSDLVKKVEGIKHSSALEIAYDVVDIVDAAWNRQRESTERNFYLYSALISLLSCKNDDVKLASNFIKELAMYEARKRSVSE